MTRDPDLEHRILLAIEAKASTALQPIHLESANEQDVLNHLAALHEQGLISGPPPHRSSSTDEVDQVLVRGLTQLGRNVLFLRSLPRLGEPKRPLAVQYPENRGDSSGVPPDSPSVGITGVQATASAGELRARIQDGFPVGASSDAPHSATLIVTAVRTNHVALQLAAYSLLRSLDAKLEALRTERSNSEDPAPYENLRRLVEEFLAAISSSNEAPVVEKTLSLAGGLKDWWTKDHASICNKALNMGLFVGGLSICALASAYGVSTPSIVTVGALIGGKNVADSLAAMAKILPGKE